MPKFKFILYNLLFLMLLSACGPATKVAYMQNIQENYPIALQEVKPLVLKAGDKISITVFSRDSELAKMFNLSDNTSTSAGSRGCSYTIGDDGKIDMPTLGPIAAEGLTRAQLENEIKYKLLAGKMLRDPVVTVDYTNMGFYVMGEVEHAGRIEFTRDYVTLLEAIAEAGDLTLTGKRENVLVLRTVDGVQTPYRVDLTDAQSIYSSPVYYIQQNDIIYVEPTQERANETKINANNVRNPTFWVSMCSMVLSLVVLITKL